MHWPSTRVRFGRWDLLPTDMNRFMTRCSRAFREYGYEEGRNLIVERRYARGQAERFKEFAVEMVQLNVDIIIVVTTPAALAVMHATKTIPIVHPNAIDPPCAIRVL